MYLSEWFYTKFFHLAWPPLPSLSERVCESVNAAGVSPFTVHSLNDSRPEAMLTPRSCPFVILRYKGSRKWITRSTSSGSPVAALKVGVH